MVSDVEFSLKCDFFWDFFQKQSFADILQNRFSRRFCNIHRKTPVSLFDNVASLKLHVEACNFIKKILQHRFLPLNITKFLRTPIFIEHLWWLLLTLFTYYETSPTKFFYSRKKNSEKKAGNLQ